MGGVELHSHRGNSFPRAHGKNLEHCSKRCPAAIQGREMGTLYTGGF
nr:MAG TPA: hypothetical protein [Caudoviricetes sp.]